MVLLKNEQMDTSIKISPLYPEDIPAKKRSRRFSTKIRCKLLLVPKIMADSECMKDFELALSSVV